MHADQQIRFDRFHLDLRDEQLKAGEEALPLTPKAFAVLAHLARHPGRRVTKEDLLDAVWGERIVSDSVLKVAVREVRKVLGDEARSPRFIETVHRRGYRFIAELTGMPGLPRTSPVSIVGREAALERLRSYLGEALEGRRRVVFVTGEPGIGKTTLVDAFLDEAVAGHGCSTASGHCLEQFGGGEPYLPMLEALGRLCRGPRQDAVVDLLRHHAPTWLMQMPSLVRFEDRERLERETLGATPERMLREMAEAVEALTAETPLVLVLEDLQWSDYATLDLVSLLARRPEPARLLLLGTYRPADLELSHHPLRDVKRELETHRRCHELSLDYLSESAVGRYLHRRIPDSRLTEDLARPIHRRTEGNPLFMVNVLDYLTAEGRLVEEEGTWRLEGRLEDLEWGVPDTIRLLVERQFDRLEEKDRRILEAASIVGVELSAAAVADALGADLIEVEERCDRLVDRRQFLGSAPARTLPDGRVTARYAFVHSLYQQVLYQQVPDARRRRLHLRIGQGGERAFGDDTVELAAELAMRFEQAGEARRAVRYLRQAADIALGRYANREASIYLTRALNLARDWPAAERPALCAELLQHRGRVRRAMGDMLGAASDFEALVATAREHGDVEREVQALLYLVSALYWVRRERCPEVVEQAARRSDDLENPLLRSHARGYCAHWNLNLLGWRDADAEAFRQALADARRADDPTLLALHVVRDVYFRCWQSDYEGAGRAAEEGLKLTLEVGDAFDYMVCKFFWVWALLHGGQWGEIGPLLRQGIEMADKNGYGLWSLMYQVELAWLHEQAGDFEEAARLCTPALEGARQDPQQSGQLLFKSLIVLGFAHLGLGQTEEAYSCFQEVMLVIRDRRVSMDCLLYLPLHHGLSRYWLGRGDVAKAGREARRLRELAGSPGEQTYLALSRRTLIEVAMAEERWEDAEAGLARLLDDLDEDRTPLAAWRVYGTAARLHRRRGRGAEVDAMARRRDGVLGRLADSLEPGSALHGSMTRARLHRARRP